MTDSDGGGGERSVLIWTHPTGDEFLTFSGDWHQVPLPASGEPLAACWDRAISGNQLVRDIHGRGARMPGGLKHPSLGEFHLAERTLEWWQRNYPVQVFWEIDERRAALEYYLCRVVWRLVVELVAPLLAGDFELHGHRRDAACPPGKVKLEWLQNPFMALRPHAPGGGWFRAKPWCGIAPPPDLPWFGDLTLWPAQAETKPEKRKPPVSYPKLRHWWFETYLPQYPDPDQRPSVREQRKAAGAAFRDHAPPPETIMQDLRAEPDTPPEWREAGRRPKSSEKSN